MNNRSKKNKLTGSVAAIIILFIGGIVLATQLEIFNLNQTTEIPPQNSNEVDILAQEVTIPTQSSQEIEEVIPTEAEVAEILEDDNEDNNSARLQFAGDVFIHEGPLNVARTGESTFNFHPFLENIASFIDGDFVMINMESPVDAFGGNQNVAGWPYFNAPFEILEALIDAGVNHVSSANNHAFDKGLEGLINTVHNFERAGITHTGLSVDMEAFNTPTIINTGGFNIGVLAYTDIVNRQGLALMPHDTLNFAVRRFRSYTLDDIPSIANDISNLREAGAEIVVISLHWGAEYVDEPNNMQRLIASELSAAGADIIMGHHSKTVQPVEWIYRADGSRTLVMYSLGNFLVDQSRASQATVDSQIDTSWNTVLNTNFAGRTQFGMIVNLEITRDETGSVILEDAYVLPTLAMRDFSGNTLGTVDGVSIMPLIGGELPSSVVDEQLRLWGRVAYEHVTNIVGREFIRE